MPRSLFACVLISSTISIILPFPAQAIEYRLCVEYAEYFQRDVEEECGPDPANASGSLDAEIESTDDGQFIIEGGDYNLDDFSEDDEEEEEQQQEE